MSTFGLQQMANLLNPQNGPNQTRESLDKVSATAANSLSGALKSAYEAGDKFQSNLVDTFMTGFDALDPNRWIKVTQTAAQGMANAAGQATPSA
jgi:hypothetical protein